MMTLYEPPNKGAAATSGKSEGGIYLPPSAAEQSERKAGELYVPPGLKTVRDLPGAARDDVPTPPRDELFPADFAKGNCKFCHGKGLVPKDNEELRAKEMVLCVCVERRAAKGLGPRSKRGKELVAKQQSWYNETNVHKEKDMNQREIDEATEAAQAQFKVTKDKTGFDAAMASLDAKQAELDASVKAEPEVAEGPRISEAAQKVIDEHQLPAELFEDYSVVSVSVARRIAEQHEATEEDMSPPEEEPYLDPIDNIKAGLEDNEPLEALTQEDLDEIREDDSPSPYRFDGDPDEPFEDEDDVSDELAEDDEEVDF